MSKYEELKKAMATQPPDRLAKIEYQSHFIHMIGVTTVCGILIFKGFWWIIFAFVFSLGVSYSQWISSYQKYIGISNIVGKKIYNPNKDKSFTRRRDYYIKDTLGKYIWVLAALASIYFNLKFVAHSNWWENIIFSFSILFFYVVVYFFFFYSITKFLRGKKK